MKLSYNRADTKVAYKHGRWRVKTGVQQRMQALLKAMNVLSSQTRRGRVHTSTLISYMQEHDKTHSYTRNDIQYALYKCIWAGLIQNVSNGFYQLTDK